MMFNSEGSLFLRIDYSEENQPIIYRGPLQKYGNYTLDSIVFNWLQETQPENAWEDLMFPVEFQLLFINIDYDNVTQRGYASNYEMMIFTFGFKVISGKI